MTATLTDSPTAPSFRQRLTSLAPGLLVAATASAVACGVGTLGQSVSPLLAAIVLGTLMANLAPPLPGVQAGMDWCARTGLRAGIVLLGLKVVLADVLDLGWPVIAVVVCVVAGGILGTIAMGRALKVSPSLTLLIACGFSVCGAAAVAATAGVTDPHKKREAETVTAVALVVLFGTAMIGVVPLISSTLGLSEVFAGQWAGASIHEIAQVVAVGGIIGTTALTVAVITKLARIVLLAPVMMMLSLRERREAAAQQLDDQARNLPPVVPAFVLGFIAMMLARSASVVPDAVLAVADVAQTLLLAAAMFALGYGVKVRRLLSVGPRPFLLATAATVLVSTIAFAGLWLSATAGA
ncbi:YeiH family protein [Demequina sp.]|uniref:YeiH family protein n=1 Tax=Demequina sp. TaxID=2050685 RepID=UPI003A8C5A65